MPRFFDFYDIFLDLLTYSELFLPLAAIVLFVVALVCYLLAVRKNKQAPGSVSPEVLYRRRRFFIVMSIIAGVIVTVTLGLIYISFLDISFM